MTRIRHASTGIVHEATLNTTFKGDHYDFLCQRWCNLNYFNDYEKVRDDTPVTCKRCLERIRRENDEI